MESKKTSKAVANQFVMVERGNGGNGNFIKKEILQSYDSIICIKIPWSDSTNVTLDTVYWNYSKTTSKYRSQFLGETTKETQAKIDSGEYVLANLN